MKRFVLLNIFVLMLLCCACGKKEEEAQLQLQETQMKSICELATMECYYHNVAKYKEEDAEGFLLWKKDKHFWMEYTGVVKLGVDASLVTIDVNGNEVSITIPPARVMSCVVDEDSLNEDAIIVGKKSADVKAEDQTQAFKEAQSRMEETAKTDTALLANAQQRAQKLLEDYVNNIGNSIGQQYSIKWIYVDETGKPMDSLQ